MDTNENPHPGPTGSAYLMSLIAGLTLASFAVKMFQFPTTTEEPSFINCFNYIDEFESRAMFLAALIIASATILLSVLKRRAVVVFIEATMLWVVAYFALVGASSAPYAYSIPGVLQSLILLAAGALAALLLVRWLLLNEDRLQ